MIKTPRLHLVPYTADHAAALAKAQLGLLLGALIPQGWPHFPEAYSPGSAAPEVVQPHWGTYLFMLKGHAALVGSGGYKGAPHEGIVEEHMSCLART